MKMYPRLLALALALLTALPALGEALPPEIAIDAGPQEDVLPEDAPEGDALVVDAPLPVAREPEDGVLSLPDEIMPEGASVNSSAPAPKYEGRTYKRALTGDSAITMNLDDMLEITTPGNDISGCSVSDWNVIDFTRHGTPTAKIHVYALGLGKSTLTVNLKDGGYFDVDITVRDPNVLKGLSLSEKTATLRVGGDLDLTKYIVKKPAYASAELTYKSSKKSVARVDDKGVVRAVKPGRATITVTEKNGKKTRLQVTVKANRTGHLHAKPAAGDAKEQGKKWALHGNLGTGERREGRER